MARPFKSGIDYYAHVIGMYEDDKFLDIREEFGLLGLGIVTKLLENIYNNGYYLKWNDKIERNFSMTNRVDRKTVTKCIEYLTGDIPNGSGDIEDYFFNKILYKEKGILTSCSIQRFYIAACLRRKKVIVDPAYFLLSVVSESENDIKERLSSKHIRCNDKISLLYTVQDGKRIYLELANSNTENTQPEFFSDEKTIDYNDLIDYEEMMKVNDNVNDGNVYNNHENVYNSTQSKVNEIESKVNRNEIEIESKVNRNEIEIESKVNRNEIEIENKTDHNPFYTFPYFKELLNYFNSKNKSKQFLSIPYEHMLLIENQHRLGFTLDDFKYVIDVKFAEWLGDKVMDKNLNFKTLFGPNFQTYKNQKIPDKQSFGELDNMTREEILNTEPEF
jgi:uncharacterized phage protein (TIGR02220 family)